MDSLVVCVPVKSAPNHDKNSPYSVWEKVQCPICHIEMWLGTRCKAAVEQGASMMCGYCALITGALTKDSAITVLDTGSKQA